MHWWKRITWGHRSKSEPRNNLPATVSFGTRLRFRVCFGLMKTLALAVSIWICCAVAAHAGLKWEQTQVELRPAIGDKEAVGHFKYKNTGDTPVRIKSVKSSCGCTTAQTQKDQIAPGESGEITATFKIGGRTGTQTKSVTVETDDPAQAVTALTLTAVIPQALDIKPALVFWKMGDPPTAKRITVKAGKDFPVGTLNVTSSNPDFQTKVEQAGKGEFRIDVQPRDTAREMTAILKIIPDNSRTPSYATARVTKAVTAAQ